MRFSCVIGFVVLVCPLLSATPQAPQNITKTEVQNLDHFLDAHPNIERDVERDPSLLNNANYISSHPDLKTFLSNHPGVQAQASKNPQALMSRERKFDKGDRDITKSQLKPSTTF